MDLLQDLNDPQREAVTHVDGPMLVLAGAGSGKTRVITHRVAWLIQQGASPHNVLAITFTNKAADEMRNRARALGAAGGATLCTFHALCARLLREFAPEAGISSNYTIYDRDDQIRVVKEAVAGLYTHGSRFSPQAIHAAISRAKDDLKTPPALAGEVGTDYMKTVVEVYREYEKLLAGNNALDFDDLLLRVAFLLRDHDEIRRRLSDRYRRVLIDEYQDTNRAQYIIAHSIVGEHGNICATGDPDQSIYAWRGADINNIMEFEQDYPNALVIRLEENYRSSKAILAAASKLISRNVLRKEKALWTRREGGGDVHVLHCDDAHSEAAEVVSRIAGLHTLGRNYGDVAIFYRLNSLSRLLEESLLQAGVPYRIARGVEFYNRKEIKDVLAYLRLLVNPDDSLSCRRIINIPARGIGAVTVKRLAAFAEAPGRSMLDACRAAADVGLSAAAAKKVRAFAGLIDDLGGEADHPVRKIVEEVISRTGLEDMLREGGEETRQALANVGELINSAAEFDARSEGGTLGDYVRQVSLVSDVDGLETGGGAVTLMTLHSAKGLEFPVVFMVGCEEGLLPFERSQVGDSWQSYTPQDLEEERRLAFVGMTRAMEELTLSCAVERMVRGKTERQAASMFLAQIGTERVTVEDLTTAPAVRPRHSRPGAGGFYADSKQRSAIEALPAGDDQRQRDASEAESPYPAHYEYLREGCTVRHPAFGVGKLLSLKQQWPQTRATIDFQHVGRKTIVLRHTELELM